MINLLILRNFISGLNAFRHRDVYQEHELLVELQRYDWIGQEISDDFGIMILRYMNRDQAIRGRKTASIHFHSPRDYSALSGCRLFDEGQRNWWFSMVFVGYYFAVSYLWLHFNRRCLILVLPLPSLPLPLLLPSLSPLPLPSLSLLLFPTRPPLPLPSLLPPPIPTTKTVHCFPRKTFIPNKLVPITRTVSWGSSRYFPLPGENFTPGPGSTP